MAEGTGLLNLHTGNRIEGSNPSLSATASGAPSAARSEPEASEVDRDVLQRS